MSLYKLVLDRKEYSEFVNQYSGYFYSKYLAPDFIEVDTDIKGKGFEQVIFGNNIRAFKIRPLTPDFVIDRFVEKCWKCYFIKNDRKYKFWLPLAKGSLGAFIIFLILFFAVMVELSLSEVWFVLIVLFGGVTAIINFVAFSMNDDIEEIRGMDKLNLILPHIVYSTHLSSVLNSVTSSKNYTDKDVYLSTNANDQYSNYSSKQVARAYVLDKVSRRKKELSELFDDNVSELGLEISDTDKKKLKEFVIEKRIENELNKIDPENFSEDIIKQQKEELEFLEQKKLSGHLLFEGRISNIDKQKIKLLLGCKCMACGIEMSDKYGDLGKDYIELHHIIPYADMNLNNVRILKIDDFCALCPNCHRMIHKLESAGDIEMLKNIIELNKYTIF